MARIPPRIPIQLLGVTLLMLAAPASQAAEGAVSLREQLEAFVRSHSPSPPTQIEIPSLRDFELPGVAPERVEILLRTSPHASMRGSVPITVVERVDGQERKRGIVTVRVGASRRVWVAARDLPKGTTVRLEDIRRQSIPSTRLASGVVSNRAELIGRRTTRAVSAGTAWRRDLVRDARLVVRGELVRLRLQHGPLSIEGRGKARDDGRAGDHVRVLNIDSKREVKGKVTEDGAVHVAF